MGCRSWCRWSSGPFTLQTQVVRAKIEVDPLTAQLTVTTDPFPSIIDGIPADLRTINAVIDRPEFMFNPTSCAPMAFGGTATSTEGTTVAISSHFQMGSCRQLDVQAELQGLHLGQDLADRRGEPGREDRVSHRATWAINQASSQSNIKSVKVDLPKQLPSRLTTLQKACPSATFEREPRDVSRRTRRVGEATAITPVLPVPLTGPAYFVSYGGAKFPELVVVLSGYGTTVQLHGETFISKAGITSSTFRNVPDVPITSFELKLPQGPTRRLRRTGTSAQDDAEDAHSVHGTERRDIHQIHPDQRHGLPQAQGEEDQSEQAQEEQQKQSQEEMTCATKGAHGPPSAGAEGRRRSVGGVPTSQPAGRTSSDPAPRAGL